MADAVAHLAVCDIHNFHDGKTVVRDVPNVTRQKLTTLLTWEQAMNRILIPFFILSMICCAGCGEEPARPTGGDPTPPAETTPGDATSTEAPNGDDSPPTTNAGGDEALPGSGSDSTATNDSAPSEVKPQSPASDPNMNVAVTPFGKTADGEAVELITLTNENGMVAKLITYGATLISLEVPDKNGAVANVVLGYDTLAEYEAGQSFFGATVGRYGNRIGGAKFELDGVEYTLAKNNNENSLHGGIKNFSRKVWKAETAGGTDPSVTFSYTSLDMEEGYPGELKVAVTYILTRDNRLRIDYQATTDKKTILNLTHHSYFNLAGHSSGNILGHYLQMNCDAYLPVDANQIPTGVQQDVKGTPFDFTKTQEIGDVIALEPGLYDHCFIVKTPAEEDKESLPEVVATVTDPKSGRKMELFTTEPGVQFYTANHLDGEKGAGGAVYNKNAGLCLETQHFPDSPHHPLFPTTELEPGKTFSSSTVHKFSWE